MLVEDGDNSFGVFAHGDGGLAQGVIWASGLDLIDDLVVLNGQVFGECTRLLVGEDQVQIFGLEQRAMGIMGAARLHCETAIVVCSELRQESIGVIQVGNARKRSSLTRRSCRVWLALSTRPLA
jgi:hypothetical protein